jgi:hypothetical protein
LADGVQLLSWDGTFANRKVAIVANLMEPESTVKQFANTSVCVEEHSCARQLSRFFPGALPVHVPVRVTAQRRGAPSIRELTVLEFSAPHHAIFESTLPIEFDDRVRIESDIPGEAGDATVVGVQYHQGRKAIAVRLLKAPWEWVGNRE